MDRKWRVYKRSESKECITNGLSYGNDTEWTALTRERVVIRSVCACLFSGRTVCVCVGGGVTCVCDCWVLTKGVIQRACACWSVQINVILPKLLLIRVINVQCSQEILSLSLSLCQALSPGSGIALRECRHLEKVHCWPHFSRDSHLHIIHFQRAEGVAKRILNCNNTMYNIDKCLYLSPLMRSQ